MAKKRRYKAQEVIDALRKADGYISQAAALLGCTTVTVYDYKKNFKSVEIAWNDIREKRHDFVESSLNTAIKDGNVTAMIFYLKTQARDRGWSEKQEIDVTSGGERVPIAIVKMDVSEL